MARPSGLYIKKKAPGGAAAGVVMREEVRKDIDKIGIRVVFLHQKIVANWSDESQPSFGYTIQSGPKQVTLRVFVKDEESSLPAKRWKMVDTEGRKGGKKFRAKRPGGVMRFTRRHSKTSASPARYGGSGNYYGDWSSAQEVKQGAVAPRNFSEAISEIANEEMGNGIRRGYRRAFRRLFGRNI